MRGKQTMKLYSLKPDNLIKTNRVLITDDNFTVENDIHISKHGFQIGGNLVTDINVLRDHFLKMVDSDASAIELLHHIKV